MAVAFEAASRQVNSCFEDVLVQQMPEMLVVHFAAYQLDTQQGQPSAALAESWRQVVLKAFAAAEVHSEPNQIAFQHSIFVRTFGLRAFAAPREKKVMLAKNVEHLLLDCLERYYLRNLYLEVWAIYF